MILPVMIWLQNTHLFIFLRESSYAYPIILSFHLVGLSLFGMTIVVTDLRLLGWGMRGFSISDIINQTRMLKRVGFVFVATCGFLLFGMKAEEYYGNVFFRVKILLLAMVVMHAMVFRRSVYNKAAELDQLNQPPRRAKVAASLSLFLWLCIVCAGRGIGYIQPPLAAPHFAKLVHAGDSL